MTINGKVHCFFEQFDHKHNEMTEKYIKEYHIPKSINRHMTTR